MIAQETRYAVGRSLSTPTKWAVLLDGKEIPSRYGYGTEDAYIRTKKEAVARMEDRIIRDAYEADLLRQDVHGWVWTEDEQKQIAEYAEVLRRNETRLTLSGRRTMIESGLRDHERDAATLRSWEYRGRASQRGTHIICAEVRRRRAARIEAFRQAELPIPSTERWVVSIAGRGGNPQPHEFDSLEKCVAFVAEQKEWLKGFPDEHYTFSEIEQSQSIG